MTSFKSQESRMAQMTLSAYNQTAGGGRDTVVNFNVIFSPCAPSSKWHCAGQVFGVHP